MDDSMTDPDDNSLQDPRPGFQWPVSVTHPIAAPSEDVWAAISRPGNLEAGHPFCKANPVIRWPGAMARDEVHYLSGLVLEREFRNWLDGRGYDLLIGPPGRPRSTLVSWRILRQADQSCALRISIYPHHLQHLPVALRWLPHLLRVRPLLDRYLRSVTRGFEWYLTWGEAVPRNQFGSLPCFSTPRDGLAW
jgi:hypothetical protein